MESNDSYPVFHTRLIRTQRRRLTRPDGTHWGWLIFNAADQFTEVVRPDAEGRDDRRDDPPQASIPQPR